MSKLVVNLMILYILVVAFTGCMKQEKGCDPVSPAAEEPQMISFASANGITAIKHSSGIYYEIISAGNGTSPSISSMITVNYIGKLMNGTVFDKSTTPFSSQLNMVIEGWGIAIPLIKKGGKIKMIIPSSLAYGCNAAGEIPGNSVLYFEVELIDVQ